MKTLLILATILGVLFVYFVINTEKSVVIKGNEVVPAGTDIPSLILNKAKEIKSGQVADILKSVVTTKGMEATIREISGKIKDITSGTLNKIEDSTKELIGNKINEALCPQK